jgi:hypothetical protein
MLIIAIILSTLALILTGMCILFLIKSRKSVTELKTRFENILIDFNTLSFYINDIKQTPPDQIVIRDVDEDKKYTLFVKEDELYLKEI